MRKIAVCLSGQPRFVKECYPGIYNNLISPNNADVFIHTWQYDETEANHPYKFGGDGGWKHQRINKFSHVDAVKLYKPLVHEIEEKRVFKMPSVSLLRGFQFYSPGTEKEAEEAGMNYDDYLSFLLSNNLSMWHSIYRSQMLCYDYSLRTGIEYDSVIRCRFDVEVPIQLPMSQFDQKYMYACEMGKQYGHISDWLNFSSFENMMVYSSTYLNYKKIYRDIEESQSLPICNEMALVVNLARSGIQCINLPMRLSLPRF